MSSRYNFYSPVQHRTHCNIYIRNIVYNLLDGSNYRDSNVSSTNNESQGYQKVGGVSYSDMLETLNTTITDPLTLRTYSHAREHVVT